MWCAEVSQWGEVRQSLVHSTGVVVCSEGGGDAVHRPGTTSGVKDYSSTSSISNQKNRTWCFEVSGKKLVKLLYPSLV